MKPIEILFLVWWFLFLGCINRDIEYLVDAFSDWKRWP